MAATKTKTTRAATATATTSQDSQDDTIVMAVMLVGLQAEAALAGLRRRALDPDSYGTLRNSELDALLAHDVLGWTNFTWAPSGTHNLPTGMWYAHAPQQGALLPLPALVTDTAELVAQLFDALPLISIYKDHRSVEVVVHDPANMRYSGNIAAQGATLETALVRAALHFAARQRPATAGEQPPC